MAIKIIRKQGEYVRGAGWIEIKLYKGLMNNHINSRERLSYESFGRAVKKVAEALITNDGRKAFDVMPTLISEERGLTEGVIEPLLLKEQALTSATETAIMILRINGVLKGK